MPMTQTVPHAIPSHFFSKWKDEMNMSAKRTNMAGKAVHFSFNASFVFIILFFLVMVCSRRLTIRAQARGTNQREPRSGTGCAIPRCLQRFVRPRGFHLNASNNKTSSTMLGTMKAYAVK